MKLQPVIAIFDVGKTNKKLILFDSEYNIVDERSARFMETIDEDGDPCENIDVLKQWTKEERKYDVVMLDPPAFTKSRETLQKAITGYKEINLRGMKLIKPGGFLVTSSCTNLVS